MTMNYDNLMNWPQIVSHFQFVSRKHKDNDKDVVDDNKHIAQILFE